MKLQGIALLFILILFKTHSSAQTEISSDLDSLIGHDIQNPITLYNHITSENKKASQLNIRSVKTHKLDSSFIQTDGWSNPDNDIEYLSQYHYDSSIDTIINYIGTVGDNVWKPKNYLIYRYNANNQLLYYTYHNIEDTTFDFDSKLDVPASLHEIYKYDNEYKQISYETRHPLDTSFVVSFQSYSYDNENNLDSVQNYFYHNGEWTHRRIAKYYHSDANILDSILISQYHLNDNAWYNNSFYKFKYDESNRPLQRQHLYWGGGEERFKPYQEWNYEYEANNLKHETLYASHVNNEYQDIRLYTYEYDTEDNPLSLKLKYLKYFDAELDDPFDPLNIIYKPHEEFYSFDTSVPQDDILKPRYNYIYMNTSEASISLKLKSMLTEIEFDRNMECASCGFTRTYYYSRLNVSNTDDYEPVVTYSIFPNPAREFLEINFEKDVTSKEGVVEFYNLAGRIVKTHNLFNGYAKVDISKLEEGLYYYKISIGDRSYSGSIVKIK